MEEPDPAIFHRHSDEDLTELTGYLFRGGRGGGDEFRARALAAFRLRKPLNAFLASEGAAALVEISSRNNGLVRVTGSRAYGVGEDPGPPALVMAAEHYNRVLRLLDEGEKVTLELDVRARFHEEDTSAYNTVADIPGTDLADEVVMVGAHLDSWHAGSGATDNAAGSSVAMEAVRILRATGLRPLRTVRIALWSGEEQGLRGSRAYVAEHFASRPEPDDPEERALPSFLREETGPLTLKPDHAKLSAYINLDNGSGRIRGIYAQGNAAVVPIFEAWLRPSTISAPAP